ncbi:MAG: DNA mismatch repair endonuclease MutL, partial [Eubacteriales bacterium]|nr:DNA mismatch repair endonuclease MutL [Eubacteriales bacterium]
MGKINILDDVSSNMIAAGEVVDRPASALKELIENSIDANAKNIAVYLKNGGNARIRVTDDGEGILREDLPKALYRHATSKIKTGYDIDGVKTLGFRGEALAAASAVSRLEIISKTAADSMGSRLSSNETGVELYETGCPDGTTVTLDDLFYNVPARRKFMKKDTSEASACFA